MLGLRVRSAAGARSQTACPEVQGAAVTAAAIPKAVHDLGRSFRRPCCVQAKAMLADYLIGELAPAGADLAAANGSSAAAAAPAAAPATPALPVALPAALPATAAAAAEVDLVALNPKKRQSYTLVEKEELSHNVR